LILAEKINLFEIMSKNTAKTVHFIGIGGIGMSGLAKYLLESGYKVSGSDIRENQMTSLLSAMGAEIFIGHSSGNIDNASVIVASSAIKAENPEIKKAVELNIPIIHRSDVLNALMRQKPEIITIGFAGTHGKTTTSGMLSFVLDKAGLNPSYVLGGVLPEIGTNAKKAEGKYFAAELDESDGTIEKYSPSITVITNLEYDHPDHYKDGFGQVLSTFKRYVQGLEKGAKLIVNADCTGNLEFLKLIDRQDGILYSVDIENPLHKGARYRAENVRFEGFGSTFDVYSKDEKLASVKLAIPGMFNVSNALAVCAAIAESGIDVSKTAKEFEGFTGMGRRFQIKGKVNGATVIDDYAHHPTEVQSTLKAARNIIDVSQANHKGRLIAVFQPHRYSRLQNLWDDFAKSFDNADIAVLCDVYPAGESSIDNISSERLSKEIGSKEVFYVKGGLDEVSVFVKSLIKSDDIVITMGAGDITQLGGMLLKK
jgi:UDP-N-acetylmuramate--alanine ligase